MAGSDERQRERRPARPVPWLVHAVVLAVTGGGVAFFAPFLVPLLAKSFAIFAALSTLLFPVFRRSLGLVLVNYLVAAAVTVALFFWA